MGEWFLKIIFPTHGPSSVWLATSCLAYYARACRIHRAYLVQGVGLIYAKQSKLLFFFASTMRKILITALSEKKNIMMQLMIMNEVLAQ